MNLLPSIDKPRRGFKFSNPLSGVTYNNNLYLRQCQYDPDPEVAAHLIRKKSHNIVNSSMQSREDKSGGKTMGNSRNKHSHLTKASDSKINYSVVHNNTSNLEMP